MPNFNRIILNCLMLHIRQKKFSLSCYICCVRPPNRGLSAVEHPFFKIPKFSNFQIFKFPNSKFSGSFGIWNLLVSDIPDLRVFEFSSLRVFESSSLRVFEFSSLRVFESSSHRKLRVPKISKIKKWP